MNRAQHTNRLLGYGAGLLSLCLAATALFLALKPKADTLQGFQAEERAVKASVSRPDPMAASQAAAHPETDPRPMARNAKTDVLPMETPREHNEDEDVAPKVEVLGPGRIRLSEEQAELLKGRGASWGQANAEAEAVLRAIPREAFTSDW